MAPEVRDCRDPTRVSRARRVREPATGRALVARAFLHAVATRRRVAARALLALTRWRAQERHEWGAFDLQGPAPLSPPILRAHFPGPHD